MKTSKLTGAALDWAVAKCEGIIVRLDENRDYGLQHAAFSDQEYFIFSDNLGTWFSPSTNWAQGGPIIECMGDYCQEGDKESGSYYCSTPSVAENWHNHGVSANGSTPLIAAMRCYVASKLGEEVEIPEELK